MTKEELWKEWTYEFKSWIIKLQSAPVKLIKSIDKSQSYEMDRRHLFKLENGEYAVIIENGCSCYSSETDAEIAKYPDLETAKKAFEKVGTYEEPGKWK